MALMSRKALSIFFDNSILEKGETFVNEIIKRKTLWYNATGTNTKRNENSIFLSHSHLDKDILGQVVLLVKNLEIELYIDWLDDDMPPHTNGLTARIIKQKITTCKKFLLIASNNGINSKWCNWELGFGDSKKYDNHIAIFPIIEDNGSWKGNEYLQIYPFLDFETSDELHRKTTLAIIRFPDGTKMSFEQWFNLK
jgi:hypothetical protein